MNNNETSKVDVFKNEESLLLDHSYDGIRELDHVLPRWWLGLLYATILFAAWYTGYYMSGTGPTPQQELAMELKKIAALHPAPVSPLESGDAALLAAIGSHENIEAGAVVFNGKCVACHGDHAQGGIGPNLTDDYWIHGEGRPQDIASTVTTGVAEKGMPPWGPVLSPDELRNVVAFILSSHGTNPAGAKAPQGEKHEMKN